MEIKSENEEYVLCVVTDMEDPVKKYEEGKMLEHLDEEKEKSILEKKIIELALKRYVDREEIIKENMNKIYGIVFGQCTPSLQSVMKIVPYYEKKSKDCGCLWIME